PPPPRGARVGLVDARDFAGFTSQHSSNLIWGGVKYMESYQFGLVAELCRSRNELMRRFPSAIREIRFLTTIPRGFRHHPAMLWAGSWLYWLIGRGHTRPPRYLRAGTIGNVEPVIDTNHSTGGLEYSDAYLFDNDARFVFGFIRSALEQGCLAANYVEAEEMQSTAEGWRVMAKDGVSGRPLEIRCRVLVNAAGAFVDSLNAAAGIYSGYRHVLSKGVHLVVPRIGDSGKVLA
ncbi:MAG: FAD-dependent oxidoreductase, partial [Gammaproteobacteria bacterium]|nr:FAD-dependent oxidoreductase [Gammaproteobacteria bacterium]